MVESGALEQDTLEEELSFKERKEKTTNYGTVATAIGNLQSQGVHIALPDINLADLGFIPDEGNDQIIFGLKGIMRISNEVARIIVENRPYKSLQDFYNRLVLTKREVTLSTGKVQNKSYVTEGQLILLIKAGAFDTIENRPREKILEDFLKMINPDKYRIDSRSIEKVIEMGIVPSEFNNEIRYHKFRKYLNTNKKRNDEISKSIKWHSISNGNETVTEEAIEFFHEHFSSEMSEDKDYYYDENGVIYIALGTSRKGSFEDVFKKRMSDFNSWLQSKECLKLYNNLVFNEIKKEYMYGDRSRWEMESMSYYYSGHELLKADLDRYEVVDFYQLPEEPEVVGFNTYRGIDYPKFRISRLAGTVLDRDKNKHLVSILTPTGVVQVKFYSGQYAFYDKTISVDKEDGSGKTVLEESWFQRGNRVLVTGFRRFDQFVARRYRDSVYQHSVQKILDINEDGTLVLQSERRSEDD